MLIDVTSILFQKDFRFAEAGATADIFHDLPASPIDKRGSRRDAGRSLALISRKGKRKHTSFFFWNIVMVVVASIAQEVPRLKDGIGT